jgi:death on curing protein
MRNCIADHIFVDGNKRTGTTLAGMFLVRNGMKLTASPEEFADFAVEIAVKHHDIATIAAWLEAHSKHM